MAPSLPATFEDRARFSSENLHILMTTPFPRGAEETDGRHRAPLCGVETPRQRNQPRCARPPEQVRPEADTSQPEKGQDGAPLCSGTRDDRPGHRRQRPPR